MIFTLVAFIAALLGLKNWILFAIALDILNVIEIGLIIMIHHYSKDRKETT